VTGWVQGPICDLSQQVAEAEGSLTPETGRTAGAALTTPGWTSTARWSRSGKRDGEAYECRNQWWNPLKKCDRLEPGGSGPGWQCDGTSYNRRDRLRRMSPGATVKCCGVAVDRPAGEKLDAHPVNRSVVNVGTVFGSPPRRPATPAAARYVVC
jgi:hypothetical protein